MPGYLAHAGALIVCFWGILLCSFTFRVLGQPAIGRIMAATRLHRLFLKRRLPVLHGVDVAKREDDTPIGHVVLAKGGLLIVDVADYRSGEIIGDPETALWTHRIGLHRIMVANPLLANARHVHLTANGCGLRGDAIKGLVVFTGDAALPPEIELLVIRLEALDARLQLYERHPYGRPAELERSWSLLCDIAELGTAATLDDVRKAMHPRRLRTLDAVQWLAVAAGCIGPLAFLWGMSIMRL